MKSQQSTFAILLTALAATIATPSFADDWVAERLRGSVLILNDGAWTELKRGDVVSDDSYIKTLGNGRVDFTRGAERIEMAGHTMIQIIDGSRAKFTNVHQHYGQVAVEAEKKDVNHFAVVTPYLAAIVKGTQFVVKSGSTGGSVSVDRGTVGVSDPITGNSTEVSPGQGASVDPRGNFTVSAEAGVALPKVQNIAPVRNPNSGNNAGGNNNGRAIGLDEDRNNGNGNRGSSGNSGGSASSNGINNGNASGNASNGNGNAGGSGNNSAGSDNAGGNGNNGNGASNGNSGANGGGNGNSNGSQGNPNKS